MSQELSKERILEGTRHLFHKHGYRSLTMRGIAKEMGYSHGALYYHFREKKAELLYALVMEDFHGLLEKHRELIRKSKDSGVPCLQQMMLEFIRFGLENPKHYEMMFIINEPELQRYSRSEQVHYLDLFASVVGELKSESLPWSLFMSLHGFISYKIQTGQTYEQVKHMAEEHVKFFLCGNFEVPV